MTQLDLEAVELANIAGDYDRVEAIVGSFLGDIWKGTKSVIKSPITKAVVGGVALAFPAVGVPATVALAAANVTVKATEAPNVKAAVKMVADKGAAYALSRTKDPQAVAAIHAAQTMINTATLAKKGDPQAQAAMKVLAIAKAAQKLPGKAGYDLKPQVRAPIPIPTPKTPIAIINRPNPKPAPEPDGWVRSVEGWYKRAS